VSILPWRSGGCGAGGKKRRNTNRRKRMNRDTGEIKDREALEELLEVGLERDKDW